MCIRDSCEKVEAIVKEENKTNADWERHTQEILDVQQEWKKIGFAAPKVNQKIFDRFRAACDDFFGRKNAHYKERRAQYSENADKKRELIAKAKELIFSGKVIGAAEAEKIGLVNAVYAPEELIPGAIAMAKSFTANAPIAVKYSKACIDRGMQMDIDDGIALENELFAMCFATADQKEGMSAFVEKRKEKHFQNK